uniref:Uncharacterized protein n=1 Tax=Oryza rufipogon TaxID=4529 RepID=A0A0E0P0V6_ORYRU
MERVDGRTDGWMGWTDGWNPAQRPTSPAIAWLDHQPPPLGSSQHDEERCNIRRPSKDYSSTDHVS